MITEDLLMITINLEEESRSRSKKKVGLHLGRAALKAGRSELILRLRKNFLQFFLLCKEQATMKRYDGEDEPLLQDHGNASQNEGTGHSSRAWWKNVRPYSLYVLFTLLLAYLFNQLDRYMLAITITPLSQDLQFGDMKCFRNDSVMAYGEKDFNCNGTTTK
ncbi:cis,cis-muconate transport protein muck, partial [Plakobranchus ocellatus]